jgi:hypothetical protein
MMKRFMLIVIAVSAMVSVGYSQNLTDVCLKNSIDSLLGDNAAFSNLLGDTAIFGKLSSVGTCDTVTMLYDTTISGFILKIPVAVIKKLNACSLSLAITLTGTDTVINYCALPVIWKYQATGVSRSAVLNAANRDGMMVITYAVPAGLADAQLQVVNLQGNTIRSFDLSQRKGIVAWNGADSQGKQVSAGRYVAVLRAGSFLKSIDIVK